MSVASAGREASSRLRRQPRQSYLDFSVSSISDAGSIAEKRGGSVVEDVMSGSTKLIRSSSGSQRA